MNRDKALERAIELLNVEKLTKAHVDEFYSLQRFIDPDRFGEMVEGLIAIAPREILVYL